MNQKLKCAGYYRLSKEDERSNDESSSISSQRMIVESFAKFNNFTLVREYVDDGYSGGNFDRPGFKQMIEDIEKGRVNCVITKDLSRLGREMYNTGSYIEEYFLENNIRYIAINDSYDSSVGDSMLGIRLGVNDLYIRDVSKKVCSSFKIKQERGDYIGSFPCYGYKKDPNDKHKLIIDPEAAEIVKRIYNYALQGFGLNTISNRLTEEQIPIPIVYKKEPRGKLITDNDGYGIWKHGTIKNILTSEMYIGNMVQHTYKKQSYRSKKIIRIPKEEQIIVENTHEPIIDKETFDKVQEIMKTRSRYTRGKEQKYLFTGLLKCKECGHSLSISEKINKKNNSHYTSCNLYKKKGKYGQCTQHRLNYNILEEELLDILRNICTSFLEDYDYEDIISKKMEINNKKFNDISKTITSFKKKLNKNNSIVDNLYKDKIEGLLSEKDFSRMYQEYTKDSNSLTDKIEDLQKELEQIKVENQDNKYDECKKIIQEFFKLKKPTRNVIARLVDRVEVSDKKEIDIYFKFKEISLMNN